METNEVLERLSAALKDLREAAAFLLEVIVENIQAVADYLVWVMDVIQAEADANGMTVEEYMVYLNPTPGPSPMNGEGREKGEGYD